MEKIISKILPIITSSQAVDSAIKEIEEGLKDEQAGLLSRWSKVNKSVLGSFRFGNQYVIAGMSGGGKTWFLNMLRKDFFNKEINNNFNKKYRLLHLAFEMSASDELIRTASSELKISYEELISAYTKLNYNKFLEVKKYLETLRDLEIDYIEVTGTIQQIYETIRWYQAKYPEYHLIISLDHSLLTEFDNEKDEIALVSKLSKMFVKVRKEFNSMNFLVAQLNADIEDIKRISTPSMHYPIKKDIHGSKGVFHDADGVIVLHTPEKLGIEKYGKDGIACRDLVIYHLLKMRKGGRTGLICFEQDYKNGNLIQLS